MRWVFVAMFLLAPSSALGRGDEWSTFGPAQRIEVDPGCTGTFSPGTIVTIADEPSGSNAARKRYTVKLDQGHEWSFRAPDIVAPCVRAANGQDGDRLAIAALPLRPGVYVCIDQNAVANPMMFGLVDGTTYMSSGGRPGRYSYDTRSGVLSLDPGATPARYQRISATTFRPLLENGTLGGFTCPLNPAKNPQSPPW